MQKSAKTICIAALIFLTFLIIAPLPAQTIVSNSEGGPSADTPAANISPHFNGQHCLQCHSRRPDKGKGAYLKYGNAPEALCRCHFAGYLRCPHPSGIRPASTHDIRIPSEMPLKDAKISCITCHDIYQQCRPRVVNDSFLRGQPFLNRNDFCFRCHNKQNYERLNPHLQFDSKGTLLIETCLYCHVEQPLEKKTGSEKIELIGSAGLLCRRCHMISGNHSGNFNHMIKPSSRLLARMRTMEKQFAIILPLDENGALTCVTCHNPHAKGTLSDENPASKGAGSKYRHRLPDKICIECHHK